MEAIVHNVLCSLLSIWQMKFYGICTGIFSMLPFAIHCSVHLSCYALISCFRFFFLIAITLWEWTETEATKQKSKMKNYFLNFTFFSTQHKKSLRFNWKKREEWKRNKTKAFHYSILRKRKRRKKKEMKIEGEHILGHYHHYQLNDFRFHLVLFYVFLSDLSSAFDWLFSSFLVQLLQIYLSLLSQNEKNVV